MNWVKMNAEAKGCHSMKELSELLVSCGAGKEEVFDLITSAVSNYAYGRNYRQTRQRGLRELKQENEQLQKRLDQLEEKAS